MTFDPLGLCSALNAEGVRYVIIGGFATAIHGSPLPTTDVDVVPGRDRENLERLARALRAVHARIRTGGEPVETNLDAGFLAAMPFMLNLTTDFGEVDLTFAPAGPCADFDDWNRDAVEVEIGDGILVRVGSLDDVIASKRAAGRDKDLAAMPVLEALRDELRAQDE